MDSELDHHPAPFSRSDPKAAVRMAVCLVVGVVVVGVLMPTAVRAIAPLAGWDAAALTYLLWTWGQIGPADPARTATLAVRTDASRTLADLVLLLAAVVSLVGVGYVIVLGAAKGDSVGPGLAIGTAITSVVLSWALVHTLFTLRYARLYYTGPDGGIDFKQDAPPRYTDFAYVAFTIGMTFQVSDTDLRDSEIRSVALRHALLAYLFGAVIIAVTINLVAGLTK